MEKARGTQNRPVKHDTGLKTIIRGCDNNTGLETIKQACQGSIKEVLKR
jgi:hypothetical protein